MGSLRWEHRFPFKGQSFMLFELPSSDPQRTINSKVGEVILQKGKSFKRLLPSMGIFNMAIPLELSVNDFFNWIGSY